MDRTTDEPILVLDLGGVLADLGSPTKSIGLNMTDDEFWSLWLTSSAVAEFETGKIKYPDFCEALALEFPPQMSTAIMARLGNWRLKLFPGVEDLLHAAVRRFRTALLSNTNSLHWDQLKYSADVFAEFEELFLSFKTGLYKPDTGSFLQVAEYFQCDPSKIVFFDDSEKNVFAAASIGMRARRVKGPKELESALFELSTC